jgi:hypothetical protein
MNMSSDGTIEALISAMGGLCVSPHGWNRLLNDIQEVRWALRNTYIKLCFRQKLRMILRVAQGTRMSELQLQASGLLLDPKMILFFSRSRCGIDRALRNKVDHLLSNVGSAVTKLLEREAAKLPSPDRVDTIQDSIGQHTESKVKPSVIITYSETEGKSVRIVVGDEGSVEKLRTDIQASVGDTVKVTVECGAEAVVVDNVRKECLICSGLLTPLPRMAYLNPRGRLV